MQEYRYEAANINKIWIFPDGLLPKTHQYYPVRGSAPAPCVFDTHYSRSIPLTEGWQRLIGDALAYSRYGATFEEIGGRRSEEGKRIIQAFNHILSTKLAFCNGDAGIGGETPKTNVLSGEAGDEWPRFEKVRVCGGDTFTGRIDGANVILDAFDWGSPPVFSPGLLDGFKMFEATQIYLEGRVRVFPGLDGYPQFLPLIKRDAEITYPLNCVRIYQGATLSPYYTPSALAMFANVFTRLARRIGA